MLALMVIIIPDFQGNAGAACSCVLPGFLVHTASISNDGHYVCGIPSDLFPVILSLTIGH